MRLLFIVNALLLTMASSSAADTNFQQDCTDMVKFRQAYDGMVFAENAVRDFEEVEKRIGDLVNRLSREGEMSDRASAELMSFVRELEREYIVRWYGPPEAPKWDKDGPLQTRTAVEYDSHFREMTRLQRERAREAERH